MSCSISVPEKPSLARANFARSNPAASRPRFFKPPLALADVFVVEGARVQPPQFESPLARDRAGGQALPATLHPSDKHALWRHQPEPPPFGSQGILSLRNPVTEVPQPRHVHK